MFGDFESAGADAPTIQIEGIHHLEKTVNGAPLRRPPWFFDVRVQGDGIADIPTHMVDQAQRLGLKYVGSGGWPSGTNMDTVEGAVNMGSVLNELGRKARARGLWVYGHNHDAEFRTKLKPVETDRSLQ